MRNSTAAWASRNLAAYSPAVATRALSRVSTERSRSNGNTQSFRDLRLVISASASGRLLNPQTRNKIVHFRRRAGLRKSTRISDPEKKRCNGNRSIVHPSKLHLILIPLAKPRRQPEHQLHALNLIQPIAESGIEFVLFRCDDSCGATWAESAKSQGAVAMDGAIPGSRAPIPIFREK